MSIRTHAPIGSVKPDEAPTPPPAAHQSKSQQSNWERVDFDRYVVTHDGPVGYVDVVPPLFVCYLGHPYARAVEIAQVHDLSRAVRIVAEQAASQRLAS